MPLYFDFIAMSSILKCYLFNLRRLQEFLNDSLKKSNSRTSIWVEGTEGDGTIILSEEDLSKSKEDLKKKKAGFNIDSIKNHPFLRVKLTFDLHELISIAD
jgi:hypothetical protein